LEGSTAPLNQLRSHGQANSAGEIHRRGRIPRSRTNTSKAATSVRASTPSFAAITPVTRKSNCSITEPTMAASATLKICLFVGLAAASFIVFSRHA
jgi:hypothetical protein